MKMIGITREELEELKRQKEIVVVDFFADWCGPCQMFYPIFEKLEKNFEVEQSRIAFAKIDIDALKEVAEQANVTGVPTVVAYKEGKEFARFTGYISEDKFISFIRSLK